jgi:hypothetical protein
MKRFWHWLVSDDEVFVVTQYKEVAVFESGHLEVSGIFTSRGKAIAACRDYTYGVHGPIPLNRQFPHKSGMRGVKCVHPIART